MAFLPLDVNWKQWNAELFIGDTVMVWVANEFNEKLASAKDRMNLSWNVPAQKSIPFQSYIHIGPPRFIVSFKIIPWRRKLHVGTYLLSMSIFNNSVSRTDVLCRGTKIGYVTSPIVRWIISNVQFYATVSWNKSRRWIWGWASGRSCMRGRNSCDI